MRAGRSPASRSLTSRVTTRAAGRQRQRHGERAVAGEAADLEHPPRADQLDQERQELRLLGRAAHARRPAALGQQAQLAQDRVLAQALARAHSRAAGRTSRACAGSWIGPDMTGAFQASRPRYPLQARTEPIANSRDGGGALACCLPVRGEIPVRPAPSARLEEQPGCSSFLPVGKGASATARPLPRATARRWPAGA